MKSPFLLSANISFPEIYAGTIDLCRGEKNAEMKPQGLEQVTLLVTEIQTKAAILCQLHSTADQ